MLSRRGKVTYLRLHVSELRLHEAGINPFGLEGVGCPPLEASHTGSIRYVGGGCPFWVTILGHVLEGVAHNRLPRHRFTKSFTSTTEVVDVLLDELLGVLLRVEGVDPRFLEFHRVLQHLRSVSGGTVLFSPANFGAGQFLFQLRIFFN